MKINIDRLMDLVLEDSDATNDYMWKSKSYFRLHGHGVDLERVKTEDEKHIEYMYHETNRTRDCVLAVAETLMMDRDQIERMYSASRAVRRWYEDTGWRRLLPDSLRQRLTAYVFGAWPE